MQEKKVAPSERTEKPETQNKKATSETETFRLKDDYFRDIEYVAVLGID